MARSLLRRRGHLGFCHYERSINCHRERSVAIYWQADCFHHATRVARGRLTFRLRKKIFSLHRNDKNREQEPRASVQTTCHRERLLRRRDHLAFCHYERSINCHRERSVAIYWQADCFCLYVPSQ